MTFFPALRRSFADLCPGPALPDPLLLAWEEAPRFWRHYRVWAVARMTGCWPHPVFGQDSLPFTLPRCRACAATNVTIYHALIACPGTDGFRSLLTPGGLCIGQVSPELALQVLFAEGIAPQARAAHVAYVGKAITQAARQALPPTASGAPFPTAFA